MTKKNKIITIVICCVCATILVALGICAFIWPDQVKLYMATAWDWLNQPLPVLGVSILFIGMFAIKLFASTSFGKKQINGAIERINTTDAQIEILKEQLIAEKAKTRALIVKLEKYVKWVEQYQHEIVAAIPNKKVKLLGDKHYVEETEETTND